MTDSNLNVLYITTASFLLFVIAEIIGAIASNSLALLGDAAAMSVDVFTYACGIWVERIKARGGKMTKFVRLMTEVYIPGFSVLALLSVSAWVTSGEKGCNRHCSEALFSLNGFFRCGEYHYCQRCQC